MKNITQTNKEFYDSKQPGNTMETNKVENLFDMMFKHAERCSLEDFTDEDVQAEGIFIEESEQDELAVEGYITAIAGDIGRNYTDAWKEIKGWFLGIESKRKYIDESCLDTIQWLKEEDKANPKLNLDLNKFKTWMKTSETLNTPHSVMNTMRS